MARNSQRTRQKILAAANSLILEKGAEHLTLAATAKAAGVSKGGLLYHFPNRAALIAGLIQSDLLLLQERLPAEDRLSGPAKPGDWQRAYLLARFQDPAPAPVLSAGLLAAMASDPHLLEPARVAFAAWNSRLENDGPNPVTAAILRLVADGLWLTSLLGLAPTTPEMKTRIYTTLLALIEMTGAPKPGQSRV